ncbi:MAG: rhodanese-like domain-containing protein [Gammaproteobacteria bacterium]
MEKIPEFIANHWVLVSAAVVLLALLVANLWTGATAAGESISPAAAVHLINRDDALVIDLRDAAAFARGHIIDALNVPAASIGERIEALKAHSARPVIILADMDGPAARGAAQLRGAGFTRLYRLRGGVSAWQSDNLPLSRDA